MTVCERWKKQSSSIGAHSRKQLKRYKKNPNDTAMEYFLVLYLWPKDYFPFDRLLYAVCFTVDKAFCCSTSNRCISHLTLVIERFSDISFPHRRDDDTSKQIISLQNNQLHLASKKKKISIQIVAGVWIDWHQNNYVTIDTMKSGFDLCRSKQNFTWIHHRKCW